MPDRSVSQVASGTRKAPSADDPILAEVVRRLVAACRPERIYLFGSTARGDATQGSDYDLVAVVPDDAPREHKDERKVYLALGDLDISKDILIWTRTEFDKRLHLKASFPSTVVREGRLLYAA